MNSKILFKFDDSVIEVTQFSIHNLYRELDGSGLPNVKASAGKIEFSFQPDNDSGLLEWSLTEEMIKDCKIEFIDPINYETISRVNLIETHCIGYDYEYFSNLTLKAHITLSSKQIEFVELSKYR